MSELIHVGTLLKRVEFLEDKVIKQHNNMLAILIDKVEALELAQLEERVKGLEEHYIYELHKATEDEVQEDANQMKLPLLTQTDRPCDCEDYPCCGHTAIKSPLQNW